MASRFHYRSPESEIMDNLSCSGEVVHQTLHELEIINRTLGGNQVTISGLERLVREGAPGNGITLADLGCGGGDILKRVARWGRKNNIRLLLTGIDANSNIISFAKENTKDYPEIQYEVVNIFSKEFKEKKFDIILATLFFHHFSKEELVDILKSLKHQAQLGIIVNDIHRHWLAYYSIRWLTRFFSKSSMVKFDAPLSVLRAFKRSELEAVLKSSGIENYLLRWRWAFRWQLIIHQATPPV